MKTCWLCGRKKKKYVQDHHVVTRKNDMDLTVDLCRGCHYLVNKLSLYTTILRDEHKVADLITLCRFQAGLPDARTVIEYQFTGGNNGC